MYECGQIGKFKGKRASFARAIPLVRAISASESSLLHARPSGLLTSLPPPCSRGRASTGRGGATPSRPAGASMVVVGQGRMVEDRGETQRSEGVLDKGVVTVSPPNNKQATLTLICLFCPSTPPALSRRFSLRHSLRPSLPFGGRSLLLFSRCVYLVFSFCSSPIISATCARRCNYDWRARKSSDGLDFSYSIGKDLENSRAIRQTLILIIHAKIGEKY